MRRYDKDGDHKISRSELAVFMQDLAGGEAPTEEECEYVLKVADASDKVINGFVNRNEIEVAVQIWKNHLSNKQDIEETFAKYDINHDNKLEHDELKALLTDLNDGHPVSDEEVKAVMNEADGSHGAVEKTGGINKTELMGKITQHTRFWMFVFCDARVSCRNPGIFAQIMRSLWHA